MIDDEGFARFRKLVESVDPSGTEIEDREKSSNLTARLSGGKFEIRVKFEHEIWAMESPHELESQPWSRLQSGTFESVPANGHDTRVGLIWISKMFIWLPDGNEMAIPVDANAIEIARLTLKDSLYLWDKESKELPVERFLMTKVYPKSVLSDPDPDDRFKPQVHVEKFVEESVVNVRSLEAANSIQKWAVFKYCNANGIRVPKSLQDFIAKEEKLSSIGTERTKEKNRALYWAVVNVEENTSLKRTKNNDAVEQNRGRTGITLATNAVCAYDAVCEALRAELGPQVRGASYENIRNAYQDWTSNPER